MTPDDPYSRKQTWRFRGKGPNGRNLCHCGCGREVVPPRRSCFSDACLEEWNRHNNPAVIARIVEERDKGVCTHCGLDTIAFHEICWGSCPVWPPDDFQIAVGMGYENQYSHDGHYRYRVRKEVEDALAIARFTHAREVEIVWRANQEELQRLAIAMGFTDSSRRWWEADHIVPVVEGGGGCGPDGYRTLCLPCHRKETAALHRRLKKKNRTPCCQAVPKPEGETEAAGKRLDIISVRCTCGQAFRYDQRKRSYHEIIPSP